MLQSPKRTHNASAAACAPASRTLRVGTIAAHEDTHVNLILLPFHFLKEAEDVLADKFAFVGAIRVRIRDIQPDFAARLSV